MFSEVMLGRKQFSTRGHTTLVHLALGVHHLHVSSKVIAVRKCFVARIANMVRLFGVNVAVLLKMVVGAELFVAHTASKWPLICVHQKMAFQLDHLKAEFVI